MRTNSEVNLCQGARQTMLRYPGTDTEVCIGDHVRGRMLHLFPFVGRIHYLPGVSPSNRSAGFNGTDQVIIAAGEEYVFVAACNDIGEIGGGIRFLKRAEDGYLGLGPEEKIGYVDAAGDREGSSALDEPTNEPAVPSHSAVDPDKAEVWTGRVILGSLILLLAVFYLTNR